MPGALLRDLPDTGEPAGRSPRRWPLIPLSIAVHATIAAVMVIAPLMAAVELPAPAPLSSHRPFVVTAARDIALPAPARPRVAPRPASPSLPPLTIPDRIAPEVPSEPLGDRIEGAIPGIGTPVEPGIGSEIGTVLPPPVARLVPPAGPARSQALRVGGEISPPERVAGAPPSYPEVAQRARIEGVVILEALIDEQGRIDRLRVLRSVPMLDPAALDAVRKWRYTPTLLNGVPVPVLMTVTVHFSLNR